MRIAVKANAQQKEEWLSKSSSQDVEVIWMEHEIPEADAYFDLTFEDFGAVFQNISDKPVFINSVIKPSNELPKNASRINAWNGFLKRDIVEVVIKDAAATEVLNKLGWKYQAVPDVPGMIAVRTIAMIINEAYFALGDEVSTKEEIDTAMKLGTNYPLGPFEWSVKIGLHNIYRLLKKLTASDDRYQPAPLLEQELKTVA
jgi:3-hydroxybutyryl-CoA dehydrogenase